MDCRFLRRKEIGLIHGFGMKSMKHLTEKYGGTLVVSPGEKYFHVTDHSADAEGICAVVEREKEI